MISKEDFIAGLENNEFYPLFQPIVSTQNLQFTSDHFSYGPLLGFELLLRWDKRTENDDVSTIGPDRFFRAADLLGVADHLWRFSTSRAYAFSRKLQDEAQRWRNGAAQLPLFVSLNVTPADLFRDDFFDFISQAQAETGVEEGAIHFELTEEAMASSLFECPLAEKVDLFASKGAYISIDDFGTGHSSLERVLNLKVDQIKIDKSFIHRIEDSEKSQAILRSVAHLCRDLGVDSVIEGVERGSQIPYILDAGIEAIQGFLVAKPLTEDAALSFAAKCLEPGKPPSLQAKRHVGLPTPIRLLGQRSAKKSARKSVNV